MEGGSKIQGVQGVQRASDDTKDNRGLLSVAGGNAEVVLSGSVVCLSWLLKNPETINRAQA
jgi:hypothetical protein